MTAAISLMEACRGSTRVIPVYSFWCGQLSSGWSIIWDADMTARWTYPVARREAVVDDYHGTRVPDPYRWLENAESAESTAWVDQQNALTRGFIDEGPNRERLKTTLSQMMNYPKYSLPYKEGGRYFFWKNDGLQNHMVMYTLDTLDSEPRLLLDPNVLREDGTAAVTNTTLTHDAALLAYAVSYGGSDRQEVKVRRVGTGEDLPDFLRWCKFTSIAWRRDNSGFFYNRFPEPGTVPSEEENMDCQVYWHALGTPQDKDALVYKRSDDRELMFHPFISEDGKYLLLSVSRGTAPTNGVYYRLAREDGEFVRLLDKFDAEYGFIDNIGSVFYFQTDLNAPRGRVIAIDINAPQRKNWREIIPEQPEPLSFAAMIDQHLVVAYLKDAHHQMKVLTLDGTFVRNIDLPAMGTIGGLSGKREEREMFFAFTSFIHPPTQYRYDLREGVATVFRRSEVQVDPGKYETHQVFFTSKDGTRVPMFITHKKGLPRDGNNPVYLYGYGGFQASLLPSFGVSNILWFDHGGVLAIPNLRGGNEYGEDWHRAGMFGKKQNVFDDFIAAAEWLVNNTYTSPRKLAIAGGSNGGLLVGACMTQRPELFGAVHCGVPLADMLRFHKFTVGKFWTTEFGNAEENPEHFRFIYAYSPYHRVKEGTVYPPTLVTTADTDDRVVSLHGKKFAAALQAADAGAGPILLKVETKAGHGAGKPLSKIIDEQADVYAFLFRILGMETQALTS